MRASTSFSILAALGAAACGGGKSSGGPDAAIDAGGSGSADAPTAATRRGTISILSSIVDDPSVAAQAYGGATISIVFEDLTAHGGNVLLDETQGGTTDGCVVTQYDAGATATATPHPAVSEGLIKLSGSGFQEPGPYTCMFASGAYACDGGAQPDATGLSGMYNTAVNATTLTFTGASAPSFSSADVGKYVVLSGMPVPKNGIDVYNQTLFVIDSTTSMKPILATPGLPNSGDQPFTGVGYKVYQGVGPAMDIATTDNFIDTAGSDHVAVDVATSAEYPTAISASVDPVGRQILLDGAGGTCTDCAQPYALPTSAASSATVSFSCDPTDGDKKGECGDDSTALGRGLVVYGRTTDGSLATSKNAYDMPAPATSYATFACRFPGASRGTISNAALAAILGTHPTRIETGVFRVGYQSGADAATHNTWDVVAGHGFVGHTDVP